MDRRRSDASLNPPTLLPARAGAQVLQRCAAGELAPLREADQLSKERHAGQAFANFREAVMQFPPTYKFDKKQPDVYDMSEAGPALFCVLIHLSFCVQVV